MKRFSDVRHVIVYEKAGHKYVFVFGNSDQQVNAALRSCGQLAVNAQVNFSMKDASKMTAAIREEVSNGQPR